MNSTLLTWIIALGAWNWFILAALLFVYLFLALLKPEWFA